MSPESIIEKVQKLLRLQKGAEDIGSLEEAANAAEKVQTLLLKHNLEMADISAHDPNTGRYMLRKTKVNGFTASIQSLLTITSVLSFIPDFGMIRVNLIDMLI